MGVHSSDEAVLETAYEGWGVVTFNGNADFVLAAWNALSELFEPVSTTGDTDAVAMLSRDD